MSGQFLPEFCQAVFHFRRLGRMNDAHDKAVLFERLKGMREHSFTYSANPFRKFAETMGSFEKHDEDKRAPTGCDMVENATRRTVPAIHIASLNRLRKLH